MGLFRSTCFDRSETARPTPRSGADGGETRLDNLVSICRHHHRLLHEGGYRVVKHDAAFRFFRADGLPVPEVNDRLQPGELEAEFGRGEAIRGIATVGADTTGHAPAWRLARARGFNRTGSRQRADWEAFFSALQR